MTSDAPAIRIRNLRKAYKVWRQPHDMLVEALTLRRRHIEFQALDGINLDVPHGSVVGIMGRNGAGKSTLLRIVAGTLDATEGQVVVDGHISAMLELGTGFHRDYTGRENVFLGSMCLGLRHHQIRERFDEIVAFAELEDFIDQPFRTYSSGMQARLTFAVATSVDPDVLIIDEALAVGDNRFQLKSFDRVRDFKRKGKSILLVTHDIGQIVSICDRAILLERGRVIADGNPDEVGNIYHELLFGPPEGHAEAGPAKNLLSRDTAISEETAGKTTKREHRYGDGAVQVIGAELYDAAGRPVIELQSLQRYKLVFRIRAYEPVQDVVFGILLRDRRGLDLFGWDTQTQGVAPLPPMQVGDEQELTLRFHANLGGGTYFVTLALACSDGHKYDVRYDALELSVRRTDSIFTTSLVNLDVAVE